MAAKSKRSSAKDEGSAPKLHLHPMPRWLQPTREHLNRLHGSGQLPHALLLSGDQLAISLAMALAGDLLCSRDGPACGQCRNCDWVKAGSHPDLVLLTPETNSGQIRIEQTRSLVRNVTLTAAGQRVFIVCPADAMNNSAANSLLKTLEEPPERTLIVLCTARRSSLPATILSRCQTLVLPEPDAAQLSDYLEQHFPDLDEALGQRLLALSRGRVDDLFELLAGESEGGASSVSEDIRALRQGSLAVTELAARWIDSGHPALMLRQLAYVAHQDLKKALLEQASAEHHPGDEGLTNLWTLYDATNRCRALLKTSARPELQLEALLLKWREPAG